MKATTAQTKKIINLGLLLSFLLGYMEWGGKYHAFILQAEAEVFSKAGSNPISVLHPFTLIPFAGQLLLLYTLFQKQPGKWITFTGLACLSLLMLLLLFIGILALRLKMIAAVFPFIAMGVFAILYYRKKNNTGDGSYKTQAN